jgi:hypothetical protein
VGKKVSFQLISTGYGKNNRVFSATIIADGKRPFSIDNSANPMKHKQLALLTGLCG